MDSYKYAIINSFDRPNTTESDSDFNTNIIGGGFENLKQVAIAQVVLTNSFYNVDSTNNTIVFQEFNGSANSTRTATIATSGNYSLPNLISALGVAMSTASAYSRTYTITTSPITELLTITGSGGSFNVQPSGGLNLILGFSRNNASATGSSCTGSRIYNLTRYANLILSSNICKGDTFNTIVDASQGILDVIPIAQSLSGAIYTYQPPRYNWRNLSGDKVNQIRLTLTDDFNNVVNLNGGYISVYLIFR
jgi:hypothetical protein